jgi:hypothetical protein
VREKTPCKNGGSGVAWLRGYCLRLDGTSASMACVEARKPALEPVGPKALQITGLLRFRQPCLVDSVNTLGYILWFLRERVFLVRY